MNSQVQPQAIIPPTPAIDLGLNGIHLIEASAGTGKTWTLSTLMVRFIVEGEYLTRQIIATTFTRAAAAELKLRIRKRFEDFRSLFHRAIEHHAEVLQHMQAEQDWLAVYLLQKLDIEQLNHASNRLQLALDSFDELFVGTLDSFCQKLLNEFAFDSGQHEILQISEQEAEACYQVMHDALRQWRSRQPACIIELLVLTDQLKDVEDYRGSMTTVLNFLSAQLQPIDMPVIDWQLFEQTQQQLKQCDWSTLAAFLQPDGEHHSKLVKNRAFSNNAQVFPAIVAALQDNLLDYLCQLNADSAEYRWLEGFAKIEGQFKKADEALKQHFINLPACQVLMQVQHCMLHLHDSLEQISQHTHYFVSQMVRQQLPQILSERGETTFSQQMRVLADVLQQDASQSLAQHIQHRYPVALVDEFQDTNFDQDRVIAYIWRQPVQSINQPSKSPVVLEQDSGLLAAQNASEHGSALLNPRLLEQSSRLARGQMRSKASQDEVALFNPRSCLVLVGDPKQAIYGFRGGDMLTYQRAKMQVMQHGGQQHFLRFNHRSIAPLVSAVDRLFQFNPEFGEQVQYQPVEAGGRNSTELRDGNDINHVPLRLLCIEDQKTEFEQVAWQIIHLLQASHSGQVQIKHHDQFEPISPSHIAVLCRSNSQLDKVQAVLQQAKVPVWRGSRLSIFQTTLAEDIVALMQVMLAPYHEGRLRRALAGSLIGKTLKALVQLDQQPDELARLQGLFFSLGERWYRAGFLAAWQQLSEAFDIWPQLSRQPNAERLVVNLRHLIEVIHQQSEKIQGQHHLLAWLMRQMSQPGQREWELERRLSGEQGVQLMTIHKSKGLEFPIVFVAGLDPAKGGQKSNIIFYEENQQRMLSFSNRNAAQLEAHQQREQAELRRLIYVALTRASMRLYVIAPPAPGKDGKIKDGKIKDGKIKDGKIKDGKIRGALYHWLPAAREGWSGPNTLVQDGLTECPQFIYKQLSSHVDIDARPVPSHRVYAWGLTSFSQLSRHQKMLPIVVEQPEHQALNDIAATPADDILLHTDEPLTDLQKVQKTSQRASMSTGKIALQADEGLVLSSNLLESKELEAGRLEPKEPKTEATLVADPETSEPTLPLCFSFPRGANAGDCLHHILEQLNPGHQEYWPQVFEKQLQNFAINAQLERYGQPVVDLEHMAGWFNDILQAQLPEGATLASLDSQIHEFEFHLSVADKMVDTQAIGQLLAQHQVPVAPLNSVMNARYLHGFIDLVYVHQDKYYIADYKSNYLGDQYSDYQPAALRDNMSNSSYWLQAALYQLALHRFLKLRLPDYQPARHLGGSVYLYLRGMQQGSDQNGILHWQANEDLLDQLDHLLGQHDPWQ
ncbi:UvrD-helicase domain-containing protein [Alkanindiges illinoisensis]|uniref:UvrD-helicase domain-containing protein n=1 Tax=Alkanindiges illinoisensis TaxID=197183 RepID=UPI00047E3CBD|nr:UvrD-helicase domain-containing protein [Alkanindiges illinoisensis]